MLKQTDKDKLKELGFDVDKLVTAISDPKEVDITIPTGTFLTDTQLTERDGIKVKEGEKTGDTAARKVLQKELGTKLGIDVKDDARFGDVIKLIEGKINSTGDEKLKTLTDQNALLLKDKELLTGELETVRTSSASITREANLMGLLPGIAPGMKSLKETLEVAKMRGYSFDDEGGKTIIKHNGEVLKDKTTHAPLAVEAGIKHVFATEGWDKQAAPPAGGRGAPQKAPGAAGGISNRTEAIASWKDQNPNSNPVSDPAFAAYYSKLQKETPDFNIYE